MHPPNRKVLLAGAHNARSGTPTWLCPSMVGATHIGGSARVSLICSITQRDGRPKPGDFLDDILYSGVVTAPGSVWIVGSLAPAAQGKPVTATFVLQIGRAHV